MLLKSTEIVSGAIPKYRQLLDILRSKILKGEIAPGERIPSEEDLIATYGLSRGTVRKAVAQLETERLIETEHGIGSFVRAMHPNAVPFSFLTPPDPNEALVSYEILAQEAISAPANIAEKLKIPAGTSIIHIARRKRVNSLVVSYSERFLPEAILPSLLKADLTKIGSIHNLLVEASEYPLLRAELEVEAHLMNAEEAALLEAVPGEAAIMINRLTFTAPTHPAVLYAGLFRSQYQFSVGVS
jgi:GntR family transcriptional regulator